MTPGSSYTCATKRKRETSGQSRAHETTRECCTIVPFPTQCRPQRQSQRTAVSCIVTVSGEDAERVALIIPDASSVAQLSYSELSSRVQQLAKVVTSRVDRGAPVALVLPNGPAMIMSFLAVACSRRVCAPLNSAYTTDEFEFYLSDAGAAAVFIPAGLAAPHAVEAAAAKLGTPVFTIGVDVAASWTVTLAERATGNVIAFGDGEHGEVPVDDDEVMYLHTSGTTGRPKLVPLSHVNLMTTVHNIIETYELTASDRTLLVMPLFHVHGLMCGLLSTLNSRGGVILPPTGKFSASLFWSQAIAGGATWFTAVPTIQQILLMRAADDYDASRVPALRFIRSCSASLAPSVLEGLEQTFGTVVCEAYAMTEAAHMMTSNPLPKHGRRKPGTVGRGTNVEVVILDDQCAPVATGAIGEVCVRGPNVTKGYRNNPTANATAFAGGYFHTGDQGFLDADGFLTLTGRIKELINRGGEKISPLEVDAVLLAHEDVGEAVCFAAPDAHYGEVVNAAVVAKPGRTLTDDSVLTHCRKSLAPFKVPVRLFITDDFPRTATGKIQRRIVCAHFLKADK